MSDDSLYHDKIDESTKDVYTKVIEAIWSNNVDQAVELILGLSEFRTKLDILSQLTLELVRRIPSVQAFAFYDIEANALGASRGTARSLLELFHSAATLDHALFLALEHSHAPQHPRALQRARNIAIGFRYTSHIDDLISLSATIVRVLENK